MTDDRPICFHCEAIGHITRYFHNHWRPPIHFTRFGFADRQLGGGRPTSRLAATYRGPAPFLHTNILTTSPTPSPDIIALTGMD